MACVFWTVDESHWCSSSMDYGDAEYALKSTYKPLSATGQSGYNSPCTWRRQCAVMRFSQSGCIVDAFTQTQYYSQILYRHDLSSFFCMENLVPSLLKQLAERNHLTLLVFSSVLGVCDRDPKYCSCTWAHLGDKTATAGTIPQYSHHRRYTVTTVAIRPPLER